LSLLQSAVEDKNLAQEVKAERLHAIFKTILATVIEVQQSGALDNIPLIFGDDTKVVNLKVPVIFIIGDMQGGDKICCTTCNYSNKLHRLCRKCNVRGDQSGNPFVQCKKINLVQIMQSVKDNRQDILDDFNQYNVDNAWFDVSYVGCRFGIFSAACPIEPLHVLENGIIPASSFFWRAFVARLAAACPPPSAFFWRIWILISWISSSVFLILEYQPKPLSLRCLTESSDFFLAKASSQAKK
jgi:hypothetical protein